MARGCETLRTSIHISSVRYRLYASKKSPPSWLRSVSVKMRCHIRSADGSGRIRSSCVRSSWRTASEIIGGLHTVLDMATGSVQTKETSPKRSHEVMSWQQLRPEPFKKPDAFELPRIASAKSAGQSILDRVRERSGPQLRSRKAADWSRGLRDASADQPAQTDGTNCRRVIVIPLRNIVHPGKSPNRF